MRKRINLMYMAAAASVMISAASAVETKTIYLSGEGPENAVPWQFLMEEGARGGGVWSTIRVPSCWQQEGFGTYYTGQDQHPNKAEYKVEFSLGPDLKGQRVLLVFDGVMVMTDVKVNGKSAGPTHHGGYYRFSYDITDKVNFGKSNLLEVAVDEVSSNARLTKAERRGDYWMFGGIFRPVFLKIVPQEYLQKVAVNGTMDGLLEVQAYGKNIAEGDSVRAQLLDPDGQPVGKPMMAAAVQGDGVTKLSATFPDAKLWSTEYPNLYHVRVELLNNNAVVHSETERFGFRTFEVRPGKGFFLNGQRVILNGVARHCFWPTTGRTVSRAQSFADVKLAREMNINFFRCVHYPPDSHFYDACDELGMIASSELSGWVSPMPTEPGKELVRAMVQKDVNHPSLVIWSNGNHAGGNPKLSVEYHKWDPQERPVVWNHMRKHPKVPGVDVLGDQAVDTRFYPSYGDLVKRLGGGTHVVMSGETIHAMYDGGGGANLAEYMRLIRQSPVGGGLAIWAWADGAIVRTDQDGVLDAAGNQDPDGIVGPYRQKEGSCATVREVFSPVRIDFEKIADGFDGRIPVSNHYLFTSLDQCAFEWQLLNFSEDQEQIVTAGKLAGPAVAPGGASGTLKLPLPSTWQATEALRLKAINHRGEEIMSWTWPIESRKATLAKTFPEGVGSVSANTFEVTSGDTVFSFDPERGTLKSVVKGGKALPFGNGPHIYAAKDKILEKADGRSTAAKKALPDFLNVDRAISVKTGKVKMPLGNWSARSFAEDKNQVIAAQSENGSKIRWTVKPGGILQLDYDYMVPADQYNYLGIGFDLDEAPVKGKTWLGGGLARVWKNRLEGPEYGRWSNGYNDGIPGEVWELPAFKGIFKDVRWMRIDTVSGSFTVGLADEDRFLGVLRPKNSDIAVHALWSYPKTGGLYVFDIISPVGSKWRPAKEFGPKANPLTAFEGPLKGSVLFRF
ncbi:glycoside hydrolase family 2 TIM barrel-domain containing protein [Pontiella sulfatireligans]|uniref:beta-galactosidase n=1 Tax=Pontiella sulfatireligans TaxID=2750658 RepID=A0A6C2UI11_9BACT|nr:glycoside hydrolase family 2 TIM barrel-domain containing protein [Pontiella sulfatireligans]VGO18856.1 Beta-galactosidase [Pontiella sulfatireligans]